MKSQRIYDVGLFNCWKGLLWFRYDLWCPPRIPALTGSLVLSVSGLGLGGNLAGEKVTGTTALGEHYSSSRGTSGCYKAWPLDVLVPHTAASFSVSWSCCAVVEAPLTHTEQIELPDLGFSLSKTVS